jgi:predicted alpha/beta-hydrolase family hydrolase
LKNGSGFILFAPGAGASSTSSWMQGWSARLAELAPVVRFDYDYMLAGRRRPDPAPRLIETHRRALLDARREYAGNAVLAGKSMGSRMACHLAATEPVAALVCFGYPLQAAGTGKLRDQVLLELTTPILFVQGTRDPLCPLPLLDDVRARLRCPNELHVVDGGDHSLLVTRSELARRGMTQADVDARVLEAVSAFLCRAPAAPLSGPSAA